MEDTLSFSSLDWLKKIYIAESTKDVGGLFPQSSSICDYVITEEWENICLFVFLHSKRKCSQVLHFSLKP